MIQFWHFFFAPIGQSWYTGNVWGNMVAWVICGVIAIVWARRKLIKWHKANLKRENERHEDLKAHITAQHLVSRQHLENVLGKSKRK
jgi:hypothetical protein